MTLETLPFFVASLLAIAIFWFLPEKHRQNGVALFTALVLAVLAPATAAIMLISILLVQQAMTWSERNGWMNTITVLASGLLVALFLASRELATIFGIQLVLIGIAYATLRHIHVLAEWRFGRIAVPTLGAYFRYHLLLPVLLAGPIHRLPHFERQCERRRWSTTEFFSGAERLLVGCALIVVIGEYVIGTKVGSLMGAKPYHGFMMVWLASAIDWIHIYVVFAGLTDVALGLCLMMGLRLEENFNRPWLARNLVDFWTRWHMTLSHWCRDYVYAPAAIWFRSPLIGIFCAMLALGLWHETSLYYVMWGPYQALGVALSHLYGKAGDPLLLARLPRHLKAVLAPVSVLAWVSSAQPVITSLIGDGGR